MAARRRRRAGYLTREYRKAKRAMTPNRVAARFISGGRHQTFTRILVSPLRAKTVTTGKNRRRQYQGRVRRERAAATKRARRERAAQVQRRRDDAAYARSVQDAIRRRTPNQARPKSPPIAVNPRTGKPITWAQAQKAVREATERAERLAAGQPGDAPAPRSTGGRKTTAPKKPRPGPDGATTRRRSAPKRPARSQRRPSSKAAKPRTRVQPIPDPATAPGKTLAGVYYAATCACQGTGRIVQYDRAGNPHGSVSCPEHGRKSRGERKFTAKRAITFAGLPGLESWLDGKKRRGRGNLDKKQERANRRATTRLRHAGPTVECEGCDAGIVNRALTAVLRARFITDLIEKCAAADKKCPSNRKLAAMARKAYPYDHCRACGGLGRVPDSRGGPWFERAQLRERHAPTSRQRASGLRAKR